MQEDFSPTISSKTQYKKKSEVHPWHSLHPSLQGHPDVQELSRQYAQEKADAQARKRVSLGGSLSPIHDFYASQKGTGNPHDVLHGFLSSWLVSPKSALGMQEASARIFHLPFSQKIDNADPKDILGRARRRFLRSLYQQTQDALSSQKVSLMLYRPLFSSVKQGGGVKVQMSPLSSWSSSKESALKAAQEVKGKGILTVMVSPDDILSSPESKDSPFTSPTEYIVVGRGTSRGLVTLLEVPKEQTVAPFQKGWKTRTMAEPLLRPDDTLQNADWMRSLSWSIYPATADGLLLALSVDDAPHGEQKAAILHFMKLPAAKPMPRNVRMDLIQRGLLTPYDEDPTKSDDPDEIQEGSSEQLQEPDLH